MITTGLEEYAALALRLARDPNELLDLRTRLAAARSTSALFDGERFARKLERAYEMMWDIYAAGDAPRMIRVEADSHPKV